MGVKVIEILLYTEAMNSFNSVLTFGGGTSLKCISTYQFYVVSPVCKVNRYTFVGEAAVKMCLPFF